MAAKKTETPRTGLEIAVIGLSGRFPGAENLDEFWNNLANGMESTTFFTDEELRKLGVDEEMLNNPHYVKASGVLAEIDLFDAGFFGYNPLEATIMDPQIRVFHECVWAALENAGYDPVGCEKLIGLYAGACHNFFWEALVELSGKTQPLGWFPSKQLNDKDFLSTRIAHRLNFKGPAVTLDTACSTSLVAIHLACQGLLSGDCDLAVAGGCNISLLNNRGYLYQEGMLYSPDGHCRAFDAGAKGTNFGNGVGAAVLKRLEEALEDRDHIYAVIKGSSINNDGNNKANYTAPSIEGQAAVIRVAQKMAEVEPESIGYVETHGTGTTLGDPVEIEGLKLAFNTDKRHFCRLGSIKTNIGHMEIASGIGGFIKTVLALKNRLIPPSLNFKTPNPRIDFENSPFIVNTELTEWRNREYPLRAGVSSFGIGGTNAHVILEEAPQGDESGALSPAEDYRLMVLSARSETALSRATANLAAHLRAHPGINLADAAYTLQVGRRAFKHRRMLVCRDVDEAVQSLSSLDQEGVETFCAQEENWPLVFMFPGRGSGYVNMGRQLYRKERVFKEAMDRCFEILTPLLGSDVKDTLYPPAVDSRQPLADIDQGEIVQPLLFAFEYALASLLLAWGIKPRAMIGHGVGEFTAAHVSGVLSLADALKLLVYPGESIVKEVRFNQPEIPYISGLSGQWITQPAAADPGYWPGLLNETDGLSAGIGELLKENNRIFVEIGPGRSLTDLVKGLAGTQAAPLVVNPVRLPGENGADDAYLLTKVGQLWLRGIKIDWPGFYADEKRRRLPLPIYPFERKRYWVEADPAALNVRTQPQTALKKRADIGEWFYLPSWKRSALPEAGGRPKPSDWLVFLDDCGVGSFLIEKLKESGQVVVVRGGTEFASLGEYEYTVNPGQPGDYDALFEALRSLKETPRRILHLWGVTEKDQPADFEQAQDAGFYSLVYLAQAIGRRNFAGDIQMTVIANHIYEVIGGEAICPGKATVLGPLNVIPQEFPGVYCRSIDIDFPHSQGEERLLRQLLAEITSGSTDTAVAYRRNFRWIRLFEPLKLQRGDDGAAVWLEGDVYLITGGLGDVGLILTSGLARCGAAAFILTGRSPFPPAGEWNDWLRSHSPHDKVSRKIRKLQALKDLGAEVLILNADAANEDQMRRVVAAAEERFGRINGVIHAAGILREKAFASLKNLTKELCEPHFRSKVHGLLVLEKVLEGKQLDFCLLMSSISSVLGGLGFTAYSSANMFMDAFAADRNQRGTHRWLSVNWDAWQPEEEAAAGQSPSVGKDLLTMAMTPPEGTDAFLRIVGWPGARQVLVSTADLESRMRQWLRFEAAVEPAELAGPVIGDLSAVSRDYLEQVVVGTWKEVLGLDEVAVDENFFDLGATSLEITLVAQKLSKRLNHKIQIDTMFECASVASLVEFLGNDEKDGAAGEKKSQRAEKRVEETLGKFKVMKNGTNRKS
jgi:acyl transferase domain-containing protein/acyl carrier protein